ncbi:MAG TPA: hypothetical protein VLD36_07670 [Burkholderiales bacterium]|nr:hypothetical protein [Burkholderiales bacterium]
METAELAAAHLADPASTWSIGASGLLAEFARDPEEACERDGLQAVTAQGAIRVERAPALGALAYEVLSAQPALWHHGVVFHLPAAAGTMPARIVVTELGPDRKAARAADREACLFDLGLGSAAFAFCVRTRDAALLQALRRAAGKVFLEAGRELGAALVAASPHRVAVSRVGRIEVYQPIAPEGGSTPSGPHTHFIPRLIRAQRAASSNIPLAPGRVPGLTLYPPHPAKDAAGRPKAFSHAEHAAFQRLLAQFGDPSALAAKAELLAKVERGDSPDGWRAPATRNARQACRIAIRQLRRSGAALEAYASWEGAIDRRRPG